MTEVRGHTYTNKEAINVDGVTFIGCRFESAILRYAGGPHPAFEDCTFGDMAWIFDDAALRTIQLLQAQNVNGEAQPMLAEMFKPGIYFSEDPLPRQP